MVDGELPALNVAVLERVAAGETDNVDDVDGVNPWLSDEEAEADLLDVVEIETDSRNDVLSVGCAEAETVFEPAMLWLVVPEAID